MDKLLIANRSEIAIRIAKTAKKMGFKVAGVVAPFETNFYYTKFLDEIYELDGHNLSETFLNAKQIIGIAKKNKCRFIHPGYGFLAENPDFSKYTKQANIIFIGPKAHTLELAEDKLLCKKKAIECSVNTTDYTENPDEVKRLGFPIMLKAKRGGGGKGLRKVSKAENLLSELEQAQREAKAAFGNDSIFFEKLIDKPKHIEAQFARDKFGNTLFLGTRDCSVQRRNQKILEEAPAIALDTNNQKNIYNWTKKLVDKLEFLGCGTVEFLYKDNNLYFMEINPRIQVEHTVTEEITGLDLIELQIKTCLGEKLSSVYENAKKGNFALQLRICAEDPYNNFQPQTGYIQKIILPSLSTSHPLSFRWDTGVTENSYINVYFDSLLGKFIVSGKNRGDTIQKAKTLLQDFVILGIQTNISIFSALFKDKNYQNNKIYTSYLDENLSKILQVTEEQTLLGYLAFVASKNYNINM